MWTTPEKHTKRRETLGNANQNKSTRRPGYKKVYDHPLPSKEAFRIKRARWNAQQNKNTNNNGWTEEDQTKSPKMNQSNQKGSSPMKTTLRWTEPYKMLKRTTKPLRRRVLIEKAQLKALKSSTQTTQTSGIFVKQVVFHTVNHRGPLPLRELHSTGETTVWRDPGGSWACLPPVYDVCEITLPQAVTCGLPPKSTLRAEKN